MQLSKFCALVLMALNVPIGAFSQAILHLSQPVQNQQNVTSAKQFIAGRTCTGCKVSINSDTVHVYTTGTFAAKFELSTGNNIFDIVAEDPNGNRYTKNVSYNYLPPTTPATTTSFRIDFMEITPKGNLQLMVGDTLHIKIKGFPGAEASWFNRVPLKELPAAQTGGVAGYYSGSYIIHAGDSLLNDKLSVQLRKNNGDITSLNSTYHYSILPNDIPFTGRTIDNMTYLTASTQGDRLGPDKTGYLDKDVLLQIVGKQGEYYKVRLSSQQIAYIPVPFVDTAIPQEHLPVNVLSDVKVWGDDKSDYISVELSDKLPYISTQTVYPGKIMVDIYGVYPVENLSTPLQNAKEITAVTWQQIAPDVSRMVISLNHAPWGYQVYYDSNRITVKVKRIPQKLSCSNLVVGLDPGHGGTNPGAAGLTGAAEKQLTLALCLQLKAALEKEGATVVLSRTTDKYVANDDRLSFFRHINPDLLLSIHLNSSVNPVDIQGTATYFKHPFCKPLNAAIHKRLVETGLRDFGNNPGFNFILNNPTEFPNALVEILFLSNPGDEEKILDPSFQQLTVEKIVQGVKDYLQQISDGSALPPEKNTP